MHPDPTVRVIRVPPVSERRSPLVSEVSRCEGFVSSRAITECNHCRGSSEPAKWGISPRAAGHTETDSALFTPTFNACRASSHVGFARLDPQVCTVDF